MALERWQPGTAIGSREFAAGAELFVIEGSFVDETGQHDAGTWMRFPAGARHSPLSPDGCTIYIKHGGNHYLICG
jgi:anti-sigma factor ChrR (cupin superfamily)